jgi:hypothetical protein
MLKRIRKPQVWCVSRETVVGGFGGSRHTTKCLEIHAENFIDGFSAVICVWIRSGLDELKVEAATEASMFEQSYFRVGTSTLWAANNGAQFSMIGSPNESLHCVLQEQRHDY